MIYRLDRYPKILCNARHWVTMQGSHVLVDGDGNVVAGAGGKLKGRQFKLIRSKSKDVEEKKQSEIKNYRDLIGLTTKRKYSLEEWLSKNNYHIVHGGYNHFDKKGNIINYFTNNDKEFLQLTGIKKHGENFSTITDAKIIQKLPKKNWNIDGIIE